jgi:hypothetical protein
MSEHLLNTSEVGSAFEQVGCERVPKQVGVYPLGLEARFASEPTENQERAGPCQGASLGVQEELRPVAPVEMRPAAREVAAESLDGLPADRDNPLLAALADGPDETLVQVDARFVEPDRLADPQAGAVEELDKCPVAERARRRPRRGLDQPLRLAR